MRDSKKKNAAIRKETNPIALPPGNPGTANCLTPIQIQRIAIESVHRQIATRTDLWENLNIVSLCRQRAPHTPIGSH
jgi:hypothetical protein